MFALALKNILFYKGRSIATFILTFITALFLILYVSMIDGSHKSMLSNALKIYTGAIEVYGKEYRDLGGNDYLIEDVDLVLTQIAGIEGIQTASPRYETFALLSHKNFSAASMIVGIDASKEKMLSSLFEAKVSGTYLDSNAADCLYMGAGLVKKLRLALGDELSFIGTASDNSFAADRLHLCGVFKTGASDFDQASAFIKKSYFDTLMNADNKASSIAVGLSSLDAVESINDKIQQKLKGSDLESVTWKILMKTMVEAMEVDSVFGYLSLGLFLLVIFFVIMIYGFINIASRIREFGMLRCLGLNPSHIRGLLFYEIFLLTTLALLIATPLAGYATYYLSINPIIIEGISETYKEYGLISDEIPLDFSLLTISWNVLLIYALNLLSIIYPYFYIHSFTPIQASHHV